jgi:hypothetical protein
MVFSPAAASEEDEVGLAVVAALPLQLPIDMLRFWYPRPGEKGATAERDAELLVKDCKLAVLALCFLCAMPILSELNPVATDNLELGKWPHPADVDDEVLLTAVLARGTQGWP